MSDRLGVAVVGCGRMGRRHVEAAQVVAGLRLVAVCDPVPGVAAAVAPGGVAALTDVEQVLARDDVRGVVIAAPTPLHVALARRCLDAGRDVLVEKPVGLDPQATAALAAHADAAGRVLAVGYWRRLAWPYRRAAALLRAGAIGAPRLMRCAQWDAAPPSPAFCDPAVSGGIEVDCGVHELDLVAWLLDSPVATVAAAGVPGAAAIAATGDVESACGLVRTAAGHAATVDLARSVGYDDDVRTELVGASGALLIGAAGEGSLAVGDAAGLRTVDGPRVDVLADALVRQLDAFATAAATGDRTGVVGGHTAAATLRAALALRAARLRGGWVVVDPGG